MSLNPISLMCVLTDQIHRTTTKASSFWIWWFRIGMARRWGCFCCPMTSGRRFGGWTIPEVVHVCPHQTQGLAIDKTCQPTKTYDRCRQTSDQGFAWIGCIHWGKFTSTAQLFPSFFITLWVIVKLFTQIKLLKQRIAASWPRGNTKEYHYTGTPFFELQNTLIQSKIAYSLPQLQRESIEIKP